MIKSIFVFDLIMICAPFLLFIPNGLALFSLVFYIIYLPYILYILFKYVTKPKVITQIHQPVRVEKYSDELILV